MSKRIRCKSPVSENTLINDLAASGVRVDDDELSDSFVENIVSEEDLSDENSSFDELFGGDDTDNDPSYEPSQSESDMEDNRPRPTLISDSVLQPQPSTSAAVQGPSNVQQRPRGRPKGMSNTSRTQNNPPYPVIDDDWEEVNLESDCGKSTQFPFFENPGPKHCPPGDAKPIDYFNLFFTLNLLTMFTNQTNLYATQYLQSNTNLSPGSRARQWKPVTVNEMKAFLAVLLNMGLNVKPALHLYWSTTNSQTVQWFRNMFSRNRFQAILNFFHIADNTTLQKPGHPDYDPCGKFLPIVEHANRIFRTYYVPHREISIDESLIATRSHSQILQYLPNKHHSRWGIKLWMICDSVSSYCLGFVCYKGKQDRVTGVDDPGLSYNVVKKMLDIGNYFDKGYHLFVDNFFLTIPIAKYLFSRQTHITGTVRRNRRGIPDQMKQKFQVGQQLYMRSGALLMLGFREKKTQTNPVLLLSTKSEAKSIEKIKIRNHVEVKKDKPEMIDTYNKYMGGVDMSDQMLYCYLDERRTLKYWKKATLNIISRMVLNSYILYKNNTAGKELTRVEYMISIIEHVGKEWIAAKNAPVDIMGGGDNAAYGIEHLPGRMERNCSVCSKQSTSSGGKRKKARFSCKRCGRGVHPTCFGEHKC